MDSPTELLIVLVVIALLFAPGRITHMARSLGEAMHEFRRSADEADASDARSTVDAGTDVPDTASGRDADDADASDTASTVDADDPSPPAVVPRDD